MSVSARRRGQSPPQPPPRSRVGRRRASARRVRSRTQVHRGGVVHRHATSATRVHAARLDIRGPHLSTPASPARRRTSRRTSGLTTYTGPGGVVTEHVRSVDKDQKITDNGDGTMTILVLATGNAAGTTNGKAIARNPDRSDTRSSSMAPTSPTRPTTVHRVPRPREGIHRPHRRLLRGVLPISAIGDHRTQKPGRSGRRRPHAQLRRERKSSLMPNGGATRASRIIESDVSGSSGESRSGDAGGSRNGLRR